MRIAVAAVIACTCSGALAQTLEATATWTSGPGANGHTYSLYSVVGGIDWEGAEANATAIGGYLATITSSDENSFVYSSLGIATNNNVWHVDSFNSQIGPWLGGFQPVGSAEPSGGFQWVTGEAFSYTNWSPGEPNNSGNTENRVHFFGNPSRASFWNDITNTVPIEGYVVEVPAPGAALVLGAGSLLLGRRRRIR
jgi:hypothetical protein